MKNQSRNSTKNDTQKQSPKNQKILKKKLPNGSRKWQFCGPNRLCDRKWAPNDPKVLPMIKNEPKITPKSSAIVKKNSKSQAFSEFGRKRPGGLREAPYNQFILLNIRWGFVIVGNPDPENYQINGSSRWFIDQWIQLLAITTITSHHLIATPAINSNWMAINCYWCSINEVMNHLLILLIPPANWGPSN